MSFRRNRIPVLSRSWLAVLAVLVCLDTSAALISSQPGVEPAGQPAAAAPAEQAPQDDAGPARWLPNLRGLAQPVLYALTFGVSFMGGVIPFIINVEVYLIAVIALSDTSALAHVTLMTLGQSLAKWILYEAGKGAIHLKWIRWARMDKAKAAFERHGNKTMGVVAASASLGFPPLYGVSLLAGTMRLPLRPFMIVITAGRFVRFGLIGLGPWLFARLW